MKRVPLESVKPGQQFAEIGTSEAGLSSANAWYTMEWLNPSNRTVSFVTGDGSHPGSMQYPLDAEVLIKETQS